MNPVKKSAKHTADHTQKIQLAEFRYEAGRGLRGGITVEELVSAVHTAAVREVQES